jgi:hypothetical protein
MAYLDQPLKEIARHLRAFIRAEIKQALRAVEEEKKAAAIKRISTPDREGAIHRWIRPTDRHIGQMVRVTDSLGMNPCFLPSMKLIDVSEPQMDFEYPFLCEDSSGNHKGYPHAWVEIVEEPAPEPIEVTPVPEHPEPVEVVEQILGPTNTIYLKGGKAYRLVNSEDIGKAVLVSDISFECASSPDMMVEVLENIDEGEEYPYQTDCCGWKLAFIEDPSLLDPKPEPKPVAIFMGPGETVTHYSDGTTTEEVLDKVEKALDDMPGAPEVEETEQQEAPKYRYLERGERIQNGDQLNASSNESSKDVNAPSFNGWLEARSWVGTPVENLWPSLVVRRAIDPKPKVSELVCEVVPAPDGSTTDPELPPLPEIDEEETEPEAAPEAPAEPEWIEPGPEHVGQMVEVTVDNNHWDGISRELLAVLPDGIAERFVAKNLPGQKACCWKHARVRKGS